MAELGKVGVPFWTQQNPVAAFFTAFQKWQGLPLTGAWDAASHAALYRFANALNSEVRADTPWGAEPGPAGAAVVELVSGADEPEGFAAVRGLLAYLGFPVLTLEDMQKWYASQSEQADAAIKNALTAVQAMVQQAESNIVAQSVSPVDLPAENTAAGTAAPANVVTTGGTAVAAATGPAPSNGAGVTLPQIPATGLSKGAKWAIGLGVTLAALGIGYALWRASRRSRDEESLRPAMGGCGCMRGR